MIPLPDYCGQRETFDCPLCHRRVIVAVPETGTDWEKIAGDYKNHAQKLLNRFGQVCDDIELIHGNDNPVANYFRNEWLQIRDDLHKKYQTGWDKPASEDDYPHGE